MRRKKTNRIVLAEKGDKYFYQKLKGYGEIYLYGGDIKKAKKIPYDFIDGVDYYISQHKAKEIGDWVYSQYVGSLEIDTLEDIIKDKRSNLIIKKEILVEVEKISFSFVLAEKFIKKYKIKKPIDLIPKDFSYEIYQIIRQKQGLLSDRVHIPSWYLQRMKRQDYIERLVFRGAIRFHPLLISLLMWGKRIKKKNYKWGLHIWRTYVNSSCQFFINTLAKENRIENKDLIYVVDGKINKGNLEKIKSDGFDWCSFGELMKGFNFRQYIKEILPLAIKRQKRFFGCTNEKTLFTRVYFRTLRSYIFWEMFYKIYQVDDFIYIQDPGEVAHVLLQKLYGSKSTFIYLSSSSFLLEIGNSYSHQAMIYYSCMPHDRFISSQISLNFLKENNGNVISSTINTGILLSSIVSDVKQDETLKKKIKRELGVPEDKIIISYFDTLVGRLGWFSGKEGLEIIEDVLRLLASNKNYFLIYKPKKDCREFFTNGLMQKQIKKFISSERTLYIDKMKQKYKAQHIMGVSDLVISAAGSSAGFEAVAGGIKNIYYAPNDRYDRDGLMINKLPKFCAYGYKQLENHTDYWLNQCGENNFRNFQKQYVRKYVDAYCDGRAVDRLEEILKEKKVIGSKEIVYAV